MSGGRSIKGGSGSAVAIGLSTHQHSLNLFSRRCRGIRGGRASRYGSNSGQGRCFWMLVTVAYVVASTMAICMPVVVNASETLNEAIDSNNATATATADVSSNDLAAALESQGMTVDDATQDVSPEQMSNDLASLNQALAARANDAGISINLTTATGSGATATITPEVGGGNATNIATTSVTANVRTAMPGYSLTIQQTSASPNGSLINPTNPSNSPILSTSGTVNSPKALGNNEWGYAMNRDGNNSNTSRFDTSYVSSNNKLPLTSKWAKVPTSSETAQTIKHTTTTPNQSAGDNTVVYYGANIPKNKIAGTYQTTVTYTATANALDPPKVESVGPDSIGQGVQIVPAQIGKSSDSHAYPMVMCYITDQGKVYCGGRNDTTSSGYGAAIKTLTSHYSDSSLWNDQVTDGAYNMIEAGQYTQSMGMGGRQGSYYWLEIDTSKFVGKVVQMAVIAKDGNSSNEAHGTACYLTDQGNVYCSNGSESYGTNTNMEAIESVQYVTPSAIDWSGQARYVGQFSTVPAGTTSQGNTYYWIQVNTDLFKGNVTQIVSAPIGQDSSGYQTPMVMCYITDQGKVYCGGINNGVNNYAAAIKTLTAHYSDSSLWQATVDEGAYSLVDAGTYTASMGMGGGQENMYWLEIDTSEFDGKVIQMTVAAKDGDSQYQAYGFACYLTDMGSVYCSNGAYASGTDINEYAIDAVQYVTPSAIDWSGQARYVGQFSTAQAGTTSSGHPYYWIKVNTDLLKGKITQIVAAPIGRSSDSHAYPMVMCYVTDQGKVYCGGRNDTTSSGYGAAIKTLTSHYSDSSLWNDQVTDGAYNMIEAGQYTQSMGMGGRQGSYYWLEIDTSKFVGKVVQMAVIAKDGNSSNEAHGTACYLTDQGNVYCSNGSESYGTNTNMEAIESVQYVTPSAIDWSGQARYVGQFSTVPAGTTSQGNTYYWIQVDTHLLEGNIKPFGNATVTITGSDLDWVTNVYVDSNNNGQLDTSTDAQCAITAQSATQITCTAPQLSPGTYNLFVVNPDNQTKVETALTYR